MLYKEGGGGSPHPPPVCSIHLDHVTAAIVLVERRQSDEANQCMGMIRWPYCSVCVCVSELMVWINPLIAISLKTRLPEGYCKCMCPLGTVFLMPPGWCLH